MSDDDEQQAIVDSDVAPSDDGRPCQAEDDDDQLPGQADDDQLPGQADDDQLPSQADNESGEPPATSRKRKRDEPESADPEQALPSVPEDEEEGPPGAFEQQQQQRKADEEEADEGAAPAKDWESEEDDDAHVLEFEEERLSSMDATFTRDPRVNKSEPRPTCKDVIIPEAPADYKPTSSAKGKRIPHLIEDFRHAIGEQLIHKQKRAAFSGFVIRLANPLPFELCPSSGKLTLDLERIQPYHMGEAQDAKGPFYQKANFVVDSEGSGFHLPRELVQTITARYMDYYRKINPLFEQNFITRMSNRIWKDNAAEGDPRTETIVPDSFYFRKNQIRVGDKANEHTPPVCTELQFECHPENRDKVMEKRKLKNDQKSQKKRAKRQQLQITGPEPPRAARESVDAFWTWKEANDAAVREQVASVRAQLNPLGPRMLSIGEDWVRYLSSIPKERAMRELQAVSGPVAGILEDTAKRQQLLNLSRLFALIMPRSPTISV